MKITRQQLRRIIREVGRSEHDAEASGMAASYQRGYDDGSEGLRLGMAAGRDPEYRRGYEKGVADGKRGVRPPGEDRPGRRRMREADGSTKKYDDDSALKGGQSKLPDGLQKGIIDKTVDDREEHEEEEREEKNEGMELDNMPDSWRQILGKCLGESKMKITKRQLRRIIREAIDPSEMDEPLGGLVGDALTNDPDYGDYVPKKPPGTGLGAVTPEAWANKHRGEVDYDEEGQKIIYLSKEDYPREEMVHEYLPREWDFEDTYDESSWVIYTGEYHEEAGVWSDERDFEAGFKS